MPRSCYNHDDKPMMAFCGVCGKPCCVDCTLEIAGDYYCEPCKNTVAREVYNNQVLGTASSALLLSVVGAIAGLFGISGLIIGAFAMMRAERARRALEHLHWLRGGWHVKATFLLGAFSITVALIILGERLG